MLYKAHKTIYTQASYRDWVANKRNYSFGSGADENMGSTGWTVKPAPVRSLFSFSLILYRLFHNHCSSCQYFRSQSFPVPEFKRKREDSIEGGGRRRNRRKRWAVKEGQGRIKREGIVGVGNGRRAGRAFIHLSQFCLSTYPPAVLCASPACQPDVLYGL